MSTERINYLLKQYLTDDATEAELQELAGLVKDDANAPVLKERLGMFVETFQEPGFNTARLNEMVENVLSADQVNNVKAPVRRIFNWRQVAVAASIIALLGVSSYYIFFSRNINQDEVVQVNQPADVPAPVTNRAMITLSDGSHIYLDSVGNGTLATVNGVQVVKNKEGEIIYQSTDQLIDPATIYHTLTNPRGSRVMDMTLSDGSRVWLNAGSSVTYPVAFIDRERMVSISGEAYFEIAHDASRPFKVTKGEMEVTVLGTHFNVNAYDDENEIKVTLLEGSVSVSAKQQNNSTILKPGQQAEITNTKLSKRNNVDLESVMAWKNGRFQFEGAGIEEVMREIARWYEVEVVYEVKPKQVHFRGGISRDVEASKVFKMLETTEAVHFRIEGNKVFVIK